MRFLDRYMTDEGTALILELHRVGTGGQSTKEGLRFLCYGAAKALGAARNQHDRQADILNRFRVCLDEAWADRTTHCEVLLMVAELTAILDEGE